MRVQTARGLLTLALVASILPLAAASGSNRASPAARPYDVNCDGRSDLAVSAPGTDDDRGELFVSFGSANGLRPGLDLPRVRAQTLAGGDFDRDGCADLALGYEFGRTVTIRYGDARRPLTTDRNHVLPRGRDQSEVDVTGDVPNPDPGIGGVLAVGDFNGDGFSDLATGSPNGWNDTTPLVSVRATTGGAVLVRFGGPDGLYAGTRLEPGRFEAWDANSLHVDGGPDNGDELGASLAAGDLDGDGLDDLVIGIPGRDVDDIYGAGSVTELFGTRTGMSADGNRTLSLETAGVRGHAGVQRDCNYEGDCLEYGEGFGSTVAVGDLDGDGYADAVIGVPGKAVGPARKRRARDDGALSVLFGGRAGLSTGSQFFTMETPGVPGRADAREVPGWAVSLTIADFDGDGRDDVAATAGHDRGSVVVLRGARRGVTTVGAIRLAPDIVEHRVYPEAFGASLNAFDVNGDSFVDLVSGAPGSFVGRTKYAAGVVYLFRGGHQNLSMRRSRWLTAAAPAIGGRIKRQAAFGFVGPPW